MNLTKAYIRKQTNRALTDQAINATIKSITWLGKRSAPAFGNDDFRVANVILVTNDGRTISKTATIDVTGYFRIS